jgi:hypothetical protein
MSTHRLPMCVRRWVPLAVHMGTTRRLNQCLARFHQNVTAESLSGWGVAVSPVLEASFEDHQGRAPWPKGRGPLASREEKFGTEGRGGLLSSFLSSTLNNAFALRLFLLFLSYSRLQLIVS